MGRRSESTLHQRRSSKEKSSGQEAGCLQPLGKCTRKPQGDAAAPVCGGQKDQGHTQAALITSV